MGNWFLMPPLYILIRELILLLVIYGYIAFLILMACTFALAACFDSDGDVTVKDGLAGNWYSTEDGTIYTVEFRKDGTGELVTYTYSPIPSVTGYCYGWTAKGMSFQYTLVENQLAVKPAEGEVLVAVVGITGSSMSLTDDDFAVMLTRYDGGEEKINGLKRRWKVIGLY